MTSLIPEEFRVYRPWPIEVIAEAQEEFRDAMFNGASSEELRAGLRAFDFLLRASEVPEPLASMIDANINEAEMRIALMDERDAQEKTDAELIQRSFTAVRNLNRQVEHLRQRMRTLGADYMEAKYPRLFLEDDED